MKKLFAYLIPMFSIKQDKPINTKNPRNHFISAGNHMIYFQKSKLQTQPNCNSLLRLLFFRRCLKKCWEFVTIHQPYKTK